MKKKRNTSDDIYYIRLIICYVEILYADNISYVELTIMSYIGFTKTYAGVIKSYVGGTKSQVGVSKSYLVLSVSYIRYKSYGHISPTYELQPPSIGDTKYYLELIKSYLGLNKAYVGLYNVYVGLSKSYVGYNGKSEIISPK